ncbi:uncharacterized protein MAM_07221 [Metarhizium album ARSEF 1941]|uniref:Uncharacterized protein n=1 Tax=Metarhizium album (strain ARSEF 1941) TaxID=1081103 RepID=A0A0B2WMR6_METAS|nr:uncharacterized protein MAM_07221 [Metarhizium album ARSEF 1941]KHN94994.1 hypothetical protein MAM_07221 [Metarhizium album ARSEF 1941]
MVTGYIAGAIVEVEVTDHGERHTVTQVLNFALLIDRRHGEQAGDRIFVKSDVGPVRLMGYVDKKVENSVLNIMVAGIYVGVFDGRLDRHMKIDLNLAAADGQLSLYKKDKAFCMDYDIAVLGTPFKEEGRKIVALE